MEETKETGALDKVKELEERIQKLEVENRILKGVKDTQQLKNKVTKCSSENLVIAFVEAIEKADQYIDFKKYIKREGYIKADSDRDRIFDTLVQSSIRKELFEKIDDTIIRKAINARICEVKVGQEIRSKYEYQKYLIRCDFIKPNSSIEDDIKAIGQPDMFPGLSYDEMKSELKHYKTFYKFSPTQNAMAGYIKRIESAFTRSLCNLKQVKDAYEPTDIVYDIVFRTRQAQYTMDQNPEVELEKLTRLSPILYFVLEEELKMMLNPDQDPSVKDPLFLARTVMVYQVPPHASEEDVRKAFSSCGDIESVEMESAYECQIADVTFKEVEGAEQAVCLARTKVCNLDVKVSADRYWRLEDCEAWDKEREAARKAMEPSAEEVEQLLSRMREKALRKYRELAKLHGKDVKAVEDVCSSASKKRARKPNKKGKREKESSPEAVDCPVEENCETNESCLSSKRN